MAVAVSYPGVYIEEVPSGVRPITGVATSIAAFVGWAPKGSTTGAELVLSWPEFERKFGGLNAASWLGYAVSQFFANGGQRAYIVRLVNGDAAVGDKAAPAKATIETLEYSAKDEGVWGNGYAVVTKRRTDAADRFQLTVMDVSQSEQGVPVEMFENLSLKKDDPRSLASVLQSESLLLDVTVPDAATTPTDTAIAADKKIPAAAKLKDGNDGAVLAPTDGSFHVAALAAVGRLDRIDLFNLLCVPGESDVTTLQTLQKFCRDRRAFLIADSVPTATVDGFDTTGLDGALTGDDAINAAFYFPWVGAPDALQQNRSRWFPPSGFVAGVYARTDATRGVWKAPAGTDASLVGVTGAQTVLTNDENGVLNPKAINCIRTLPVYGTVVWGARTLQGNDERGSEWKYIPVRRTALFIEETLYRALKWVVFEPNDEPLWAQVRLNVGAFMHNLFRQGAFQGKTPREAYFVKCDDQTTTQNDINLGIVNILVGFAPLKPAEFVIVKIQQIAGQIQT